MSERRRRAEGGRGTLRRTRSRAGIQACGAGTTKVAHRARRRQLEDARGTHAPPRASAANGDASENRGRLLRTPLTQPGESAPPVEELVNDPRLGMRRRFLATVPVVAAVETPAASDLCTDAPEGAPPRRGTQRLTRHHRMTTVSSTSIFRRRRRRRRRCRRRRRRCRRLLLGRQAAGRGTTFGAGCAALRAASAPSPPHLQCTRALSAIDPCCCMRARARHPSLGAAVRAPTGPAWSPSSSPPQRERVKARGERSAPVDGKWRECYEQVCRPRAPHASVGRSAGMSWQD
jgi:hypothetical protein